MWRSLIFLPGLLMHLVDPCHNAPPIFEIWIPVCLTDQGKTPYKMVLVSTRRTDCWTSVSTVSQYMSVDPSVRPPGCQTVSLYIKSFTASMSVDLSISQSVSTVPASMSVDQSIRQSVSQWVQFKPVCQSTIQLVSRYSVTGSEPTTVDKTDKWISGEHRPWLFFVPHANNGMELKHREIFCSDISIVPSWQR